MAQQWIKHDGGKMPIEASAIVDIKWADGAKTYGETAGHYDWTKRRGKKLVIVAYAS